MKAKIWLIIDNTESINDSTKQWRIYEYFMITNESKNIVNNRHINDMKRVDLFSLSKVIVIN